MQNNDKTITIYDIAKEAGVSASTVSRVLTNSANVRSEKKEKIMALIEKYNFKPNVMARGLADTKTHTIGIWYPRKNMWSWSTRSWLRHRLS